MAHWKYKIDIKQYWQMAKLDVVTPPELAKVILKHLRPIAEREPNDDELESLIYDFEAVDESFTWDDFDEIMEKLYDWGDTDVGLGLIYPPERLCWIGTF